MPIQRPEPLDIVTVTATTFTVGDQDVVLVDDDTAGGVCNNHPFHLKDKGLVS